MEGVPHAAGEVVHRAHITEVGGEVGVGEEKSGGPIPGGAGCHGCRRTPCYSSVCSRSQICFLVGLLLQPPGREGDKQAR